MNGPNDRQNTDITTKPSMIIRVNENVLQEILAATPIKIFN